MDGRSPEGLEVRREEFDEALISFFRCTHVFGITIREGTYVSVAEWTNLSLRHDMSVTAAAQDQFFPRHSPFGFLPSRAYLHKAVCEGELIDDGNGRLRLNCRGGPLWPPVGRIHSLEYQFEPAVVERSSRRSFHLSDTLAQSLLRQLERAMMAIRIVPGATEQHTRGPGATRFARVSVVTTPTEAP
jgi:hypothetical protein